MEQMVFLLSFASVIIPKISPVLWQCVLVLFIFYCVLYKRSNLTSLGFLIPYGAITAIPYFVSLIFPPFIGAEPGLTFSLCAFAVGVLASQINSVHAFFGLLSGYVISAVLVGATYQNSVLFDEASFWRDQGRMSGFMTDPNALSICAFMLLGFLDCTRQQWMKILMLLLSLILGAATGGRIYFLGFILFFTFYFSKNFRFKTVSIISLCVSVLMLFIIPHDKMPLGIKRIYETVTFQNLDSNLMNRVQFNKVSISMFLENPIFGVGVGNYKRELLPYSMNTLGAWSDNANNLYLQILVEQGLFGIMMLFLTCLYVRRNNFSEERSALITLGIFVFLLLFGPHVEFLEVSFVLGVLFVKCFCSIPVSTRVKTLSTLSASALALLTVNETRGVYPYENDGAFFRWSKERAALHLSCDESLWVSSGRIEKVKVMYWVEDDHDSIEVGSDPVKLPIECEERSRLVTLSVSRTISPDNDERILGVKTYLRR